MDRNYFENSIDVFFNLLLIFGIPLFMGWMGCIKFIQTKNFAKRPRRRLITRTGGVFALVFMLGFAGVISRPYTQPYKQFFELHEKAQAGEVDQEISATFPPIPFGYRKTGFNSLDTVLLCS